jgi:hypothetical protein
MNKKFLVHLLNSSSNTIANHVIHVDLDTSYHTTLDLDLDIRKNHTAHSFVLFGEIRSYLITDPADYAKGPVYSLQGN